ncbi:acyl-CoA dehydrogenase family protein [Pseudofrankia inefficax]|uniref:Acyl-CoA dehydrogenase domain-containing protein n=1 Tax=Pseudofrankia inefficax (strain DSM 45817 / CECT 9037 / DDB 130130 / EuI1c) TaxID=298654 RepID=E3JD37_PSEI1|nr:acyl-CoA dehydrogenase family protein [Pseudofrankia inefficax]ADP81176.1 acyl-CoA dehydrogenase domain-containing protein [Pseudofrankia inefficax]
MTGTTTGPARADEDAFLAAACLALRAPGEDDPDAGREDPLDTLGWWDLLTDLADPETRAAVFTLFRAQGRELASSAALGALLAEPFRPATGLAAGTMIATVTRQSGRHGPRHVVLGDATGRHLLVDRPGDGAVVLAAADVPLRPVAIAGRLAVHELDPDAATAVITLDESTAAAARARSLFLGRVALASEILGAAETALADAVAYAGTREQFGRPIGTFQAVRHLLAAAATDAAALASVTAQAVSLDAAAPPHHDEVVKALAGRNGRLVCERALQVLGGIGFTSEHSHHHLHSRVLALDALLGTSAALTHGLGARLRQTRGDTAVPLAALLSAGR